MQEKEYKANNLTVLSDYVNSIIKSNNLQIEDVDLGRPWGGFYRLDNADAEKFIDMYFADIKESFISFEDLSPKFLLVAPGKRLSWQYHFRRAEIWRVLEGPVGVKLSDSDDEPSENIVLENNEIIQFEAEKRHRLIGLDNWGIVAEIWKHTNHDQPSDEQDIVRVADDFGR